MPTLIQNVPPEVAAIALDTNHLHSYVVVIENALPLDFCDEVVAEFNDPLEWNSALVGHQGNVDRNIRNADVISLSTGAVLQKNPKKREKFEAALYGACRDALRQYQALFPYCRIVEGMGFELLRYSTGGFYRTHTDSFKKVPRALACSFALNDAFEGGHWSFFEGQKTVNPPKGSIVMFPSNFLYPHEITEIRSGTRYSIVTWMI